MGLDTILSKLSSKHPCPAHLADARSMAAEGMVLLKNDHHVLPLPVGKVALFGTGAVDTVSCGTGSGYVFAPYDITVEQGLREAGFELTSKTWLKRFEKASKQANKKDKTLSVIDRFWSGLKIHIDDLEITDAELHEAKAADTAIYVLSRNAGENHDRKAEKGDYYLTDTERKNLERIAENFAHTVVVLNTCVVDANFLFEIPGIDGAVLMGLGGCEGGNALADVLCGKVNPSGKLTDTWARQYSDYPASAAYSQNDGDSEQETYTEDIFVGYRYFDTFGIEPLFPFGYGLSYTDFRVSDIKVSADWNEVRVTATVENCGNAPGMEVVQVYVTAPEGVITKPYQELKGFGKTALLRPGQSEIVTVTIPTENLASYDAERAAFVMEAGDYIIRVGNHSRNTTAAAVLRLDAEAIVRQVRNEVCPDRAFDILQAPERKPETVHAPVIHLRGADCVCVDGTCKIPRVTNIYAAEGTAPIGGKLGNLPFACEQKLVAVKACPDATLPDVKAGRISMEEFVASLDVDVLLRLVTGIANETKYEVPARMKQKVNVPKPPRSSGNTTTLFTKSLGIPGWYMTDGPAGLHIPMHNATCYPVGMVMAQTWNEQTCQKMGNGVGEELRAYKHSVILGPGMNIHRDPLCGRHFEYYSEDPLITGKIAAATTRGVQSVPGAGVSIKHFACNNQEESRTTGNSTVSERALREIYLRGFEICVREAAPCTVMTSYNKLNGIQTSSHYELLTEVLRGEWGFKGTVMTDWGTKSNKAFDLHAGNDLIMGGYRTQALKSALLALAPEFGEDGYIKTEVSKVYGGFFTETVEYWNTFVPCADGADVVQAKVNASVKLNEKVSEMAQKGIAVVEEHSDGSKTVTYKGTNRGASLSLGDIQACAMRVLNSIMHSSAYDDMG